MRSHRALTSFEPRDRWVSSGFLNYQGGRTMNVKAQQTAGEIHLLVTAALNENAPPLRVFFIHEETYEKEAEIVLDLEQELRQALVADLEHLATKLGFAVIP